MSVQSSWVRYGDQQQFTGYLACQEGTQDLPAVVVLQEIWGVDEHIEDVTRRFAAAGYLALAPDLYAVNGERPAALTRKRSAMVQKFLETVPPAVWSDREQREQAFEDLPADQREPMRESFGALFGDRDEEKFVEQMVATTAYLRQEHPVSQGQAVVSTGYCMGGGLSALLACHDPELVGAAVYYGRPPADELIENIQCPVAGFYGELDKRVTGTVSDFRQKMEEAGKMFTPHIYKGANHAFFNDRRRSYDPDAARDAFARTLTFFNQVTGEAAAV